MRRVVVTGAAPWTICGRDRRTFWDSICHARSAITWLEPPYPEKTPAGLLNIDPATFTLHGKEARLDITGKVALAAGLEAATAAGLHHPEAVSAERAGVILGSSRGPHLHAERVIRSYYSRDTHRVRGSDWAYAAIASLSGAVGHRLAWRGPNLVVSSACSAASQAIGVAMMLIRAGMADAIITGGVEFTLSPMVLDHFRAIGVVASHPDDPTRACRPFDRDHNGTVFADGATVLVLEDERHARLRGAPILAEIVGFASTHDPEGYVGADDEGVAEANALRESLRQAGVQPEDVDYINAHGTGTRANDLSEAAAIRAALGPAANAVPVSSTKPVHGHTIGAAGAIEALVCIESIIHRTVPHTLNLDDPDPNCYLPGLVCREPLPRDVRVAVSLSAGFWGSVTSLVFARYQG